jgi:hypothetical protein
MSQLIKVMVGDMQIWMEPDQAAVGSQAGIKKVSVEGAATELAESADTISVTVKAYCSNLIKGIKELPAGIIPKSVTAEFGIKLSAEGTVFVAKTSGEASLKITAEWQLG